MGEYIITDLTRFNKPGRVCIGVIDLKSGQCFRPMPYKSTKWVDEMDIQPGDVLKGKLKPKSEAESPHVEDATYHKLEYKGTLKSKDFKKILKKSVSQSVDKGFGANVWYGKYLPANTEAKRSLITIEVAPNTLKISKDAQRNGRIRASFVDEGGSKFENLSVADRGFPSYGNHTEATRTLRQLHESISTQKKIFLRIGVSRYYKIGDRFGYWLQVNGIYMFPELKKMDDLWDD